MQSTRYTHVIWDWNGTLLDDADWGMQRMNAMLRKRGLPTLENLDAYHRVFGFPVVDYYRRVGIDLERESFEQLAVEFIELYHSGADRLRLFPDAEATLAAIRGAGIRQVILSASERGNLLSQLGPFDILHYFDEILGISDIYAGSKTDVGHAYMKRAGTPRAVLIGDTTHDHEVAAALGVDCVLVARGHQSAETLRECGVPVVNTLGEVLKKTVAF